MHERVKPLRDAFDQASAAFAETVKRTGDTAWSNVCAPEGWTVAALAHHVAKGHARSAEWIATMTAGQRVSLSEEELDSENAEDARRFVAVSKADVLSLHERNGALLRALLNALSAEDLDRHAVFGPAGGSLFPVERIAGAATRHIEGHMGSLRQTLEAG
jgi:DinB superfamily